MNDHQCLFSVMITIQQSGLFMRTTMLNSSFLCFEAYFYLGGANREAQPQLQSTAG